MTRIDLVVRGAAPESGAELKIGFLSAKYDTSSSADAARNHNLQVVYVHLIGETLGSALLVSYLADRGEGGAVAAGTQFTRFTRTLAQILTPGWGSETNVVLIGGDSDDVSGAQRMGTRQPRFDRSATAIAGPSPVSSQAWDRD